MLSVTVILFNPQYAVNEGSVMVEFVYCSFNLINGSIHFFPLYFYQISEVIPSGL